MLLFFFAKLMRNSQAHFALPVTVLRRRIVNIKNSTARPAATKGKRIISLRLTLQIVQ
nr:hypothetical protein [Aneurinibacillus tyrosinisolvens]